MKPESTAARANPNSKSLPSSPANRRKRLMDSAATTSSKNSLPQPDVQPRGQASIKKMPDINKSSTGPMGRKEPTKLLSAGRKPMVNGTHLPPANNNSTNKQTELKRLDAKSRNVAKAMSTDSVFNEALKRESDKGVGHGVYAKLSTLQFVEAYSQIEKIMAEVLRAKNVLNESVRPVFTVIDKYCKAEGSGGQIPQQLADVWNQSLVVHGLAKLYRHFWDQFWTQADYHKWVPKKFKAGEEAKRALEYFDVLNDCIVNTTDDSTVLCHQLIEQGFTTDFVKALEKIAPNVQSSLDERIGLNSLRLSMVTICSNILRLFPESAKRFRDDGAVAVLLQYMTHYSQSDSKSNNELRAILACCIAYTVQEDDRDALKVASSAVAVLVGIELKSAVHRASRRSEGGFSSVELLEALNKLASLDSVKHQLVDEKTHFAVLADTYKQENNWEELIQISQLFWTLSFDEHSRKNTAALWPTFIRHLERMDPASNHKLKPFDDKKNALVLKNVEGTQWNYGEKGPHSDAKPGHTKPLAQDIAPKMIGQVMISYDWGHQDLVLKLNKHLRSAGVSTWIDIEQMSGSTLDAMADAVQNSVVVLVCFSERYKDSPNCRAEAEFAFKLNKTIIPIRTQAGYKPGGWLGMILGTKLYFNCYDDHGINESSPKIIDELGKYLKVDERRNSLQKSLSPPASATKSLSRTTSSSKRSGSQPRQPDRARQTQPDRPRPSQTDLAGYSNAQLMVWLERHGLADLKTNLSDFDGQTLARLYQVFQTSPQAVLNHKQFHNVHDTLKLINAVEKELH